MTGTVRVVTLTVRSSPWTVEGRGPVRVDWQVESDEALPQLGYELQASADPAFDVPIRLGGEGDRQLDVEAPGGPLHSRELRHLRVRVRTEAGWSTWSPTATVEAGLLRSTDWAAVAVTLPDDPGRYRSAPAPLVRGTFRVDAPPARARLHVTSLGTHEVRLNGTRVGDHWFEPGWTPYRRRLLVRSHDVTALLHEGDNVLAGVLGDGWFRGRAGWGPDGDRLRYGSDVALVAQLEIDLADGSRVVTGTGPQWRASTGEIAAADHYEGCTVDLRERQEGWDRAGFDDSAWVPVAVLGLDPELLRPASAPPVRAVSTLPMTLLSASRGTVRLDSGQNCAGVVRLTVRGSRGQTVVVRHAEMLLPDGSLHTRPLRSAVSTDRYTLDDDGVAVLEPVFTFHGFRYAEVLTEAEVLSAEVLVLSSDLPDRATFACSDQLLSRLHENVRWSLRSNLLAVPTDCPQRDERLGYTGDAQGIAPAASTLLDGRAFWASWLADLALEQRADGRVTTTVPDVLGDHPYAAGQAGWADAAVLLPWAVHVAHDDAALLLEQLPSMRAHVASLEARCGSDGLVAGGQQLGDWLDPGAPGDRPHEAPTPPDYLVNAFFVRSARLLARAEELLGGDPRPCRRLADDVAMRTWARWRQQALATQTGCAVAIEFDLVPAAQRMVVGRALARLVRRAEGAIGTGFLGTPLVLHALSRTGHLSEAYLMLLRREPPSWLYQVLRGATTMWERWDAVRPDGSFFEQALHLPDGDHDLMLSFNHYAFGAVADWVHRTLAGVAPADDAPGYRHVLLAPRPVLGVREAALDVHTGYGVVSARWQLADDGWLAGSYVLPFGVTATLSPPTAAGWSCDGRSATGPVVIGPGAHEVLVPAAVVADPWSTTA